MKKIFLLMLMAPLYCWAQKCVSKVLPTGEKLKVAIASVLYEGDVNIPLLTITQLDTSKSLGFTFTAALDTADLKTKKMITVLSFKDGRMLKIINRGKLKTIKTSSYPIVRFEGAISTADVLYIKDNPLDTIKVFYEGDDKLVYQVPLSNKIAEKVKEMINCLL